MRTERNKDGSWNVWMNREEYHELPRSAADDEREVAIRLMGDCGLRVAETLDVTPSDVKRTTDGAHHMLNVEGGKDTTGEYDDGKQRETWLPRETEVRLARLGKQRDLDDDEPYITVGKRQVQNWLADAAATAAEERDNDDYRKLSTHDLRRCWANHLLVEEHVSPRIVMALGGWSSYDAIEPYLAEPSESNIIESMTAASL
jgi:integrase